jgi:hypothetical protein
VFNDDDTLPFHLACLLRKELVDAKSAVLAHAPALLA